VRVGGASKGHAGAQVVGAGPAPLQRLLPGRHQPRLLHQWHALRRPAGWVAAGQLHRGRAGPRHQRHRRRHAHLNRRPFARIRRCCRCRRRGTQCAAPLRRSVGKEVPRGQARRPHRCKHPQGEGGVTGINSSPAVISLETTWGFLWNRSCSSYWLLP